jgi:mediator of RNA polymerase II transcription subunit 7
MAEEKKEEAAGFSEFLPAPPPFWRQFTSRNLQKVKDIQERGEDVPDSLRALVPPLPPVDGKYRSFGGYFVVRAPLLVPRPHQADQMQFSAPLPSLEEQGLEQLYPSTALETSGPPAASSAQGTAPEWTLDKAFYLKKTARSILLNFLEFIDLLSQNPDQKDAKIKDLEALFLNAHHMINEYRPHQARETLIMLMEEQLARKKAEIQAIKSMQAKMDGLAASLPTGDTPDDVGQDLLRLRLSPLPVNGVESAQSTAGDPVQTNAAIWQMVDEEQGTDESISRDHPD